MLSFSQFALSESSRKSEWGFLRPGQPTLKRAGTRANHSLLAMKMGFPTHDEALKAGHVRFYHNAKGDYLPFGMLNDKSRAGYELNDTPQARALVVNHLRKSGGFPEVYIDYRHPKTGALTAHTFHGTEDAIKHLES